MFDFGTILSIGGSLLGGLMGNEAADSAANAQTQAAQAAIDEQRRQYDLTRGDLLGQYQQARADAAPYMDAGSSAVIRLRNLLELGTEGITGLGTGSTPSAYYSAPQRSLADIMNELRASGQYTTAAQQGQQIRGTPILMPNPNVEGGGEWWYQFPDGTINRNEYKLAETAPSVNEAALRAEAQRIFDAEQARRAMAQQAAQASQQAAHDPSQPYGDSPLLRRFTANDLALDPVYQSGLQFGLDEGNKAINARAVAGGGWDSGATLKALTRFANDYASTKAHESYGRFVNDQTNVYNRLAGLSGTGQVSAGNVGTLGMGMQGALASAGQNAARDVAGAMMDAGNARSAGIVGGANAWGNAFGGANQAINNYNSNQMLQRILANRGGGMTYGGSLGYGGLGGGWTGGLA